MIWSERSDTIFTTYNDNYVFIKNEDIEKCTFKDSRILATKVTVGCKAICDKATLDELLINDLIKENFSLNITEEDGYYLVYFGEKKDYCTKWF